jgi:Bacterial PH domain
VVIYAANRRIALLAFAIVAALGVAIGLSGGLGLAIGVPLVVVAVVLAILIQRRPRLEADERGLAVVGVIRTVQIPWIEITALHMARVGRRIPYLTLAGGDPDIGWLRPQNCLAIDRKDGTTVHARVVTDDDRTGYSRARVEDMVRDLSDRWAHGIGTQQ